LRSNLDVTVMADAQDVAIISVADPAKDGNWPDPSLLNVDAQGAEDVRSFFAIVNGGASSTI
jgi:hypothetical protein